MANVNRTVASPWAFWPDQTDSLAQRDTGWIQYYVETAQEALDTVLHAFRVAEQVSLPAMVNLDAFYVSHALEPVQVPSQELVDGYLPPYAPEHRLDIGIGSSWGNVVSAEMFNRTSPGDRRRDERGRSPWRRKPIANGASAPAAATACWSAIAATAPAP